MPKNLALCFDGTWNKPGEKDGSLPAPTNVSLLHEQFLPADDPARQLKYYHSGVGTGGDWFDRMTGGINGAGLTANVVDGYRWLAQNFAPGDRVFLFGFSRGAFTARSVAGIVRKCGILRPENAGKAEDAMTLYQDRGDDVDSAKAKAFRRDFAQPIASADGVQGIYFIGVWDTVGALGIPLEAFKGINSAFNGFHDEKLSRSVSFAYHALAIDEHRKPFLPTLWKVHEGPDANPAQVVEQRWFAGAHSNVGGGYADRGLSDCALQWMSQKASAAGLLVNAAALAPNPAQGVLRDSFAEMFSGWKVALRLFNFPTYRTLTLGGASNEKLDPSVLVRLRSPAANYRPKNLLSHGEADALEQFVGTA